MDYQTQCAGNVFANVGLYSIISVVQQMLFPMLACIVITGVVF